MVLREKKIAFSLQSLGNMIMFVPMHGKNVSPDLPKAIIPRMIKQGLIIQCGGKTIVLHTQNTAYSLRELTHPWMPRSGTL